MLFSIGSVAQLRTRNVESTIRRFIDVKVLEVSCAQVSEECAAPVRIVISLEVNKVGTKTTGRPQSQDKYRNQPGVYKSKKWNQRYERQAAACESTMCCVFFQV